MLRYASARVHPEDRAAYLDKVDMDGLLGGYYRGVRNIIFEYRQLTPNGVYHWVRANIDLVEYPDTTDIEAYIVYEDIDDSKRAELLTIERAETDPLTGLLNRSVFTSRARARMRVSKPETRHAFMILDVDGFKAVNDAFGHAAGDEALVEIASSLRSILRSSDLIGRLGGDEFVLFLGDISSEEAAGSKARQICAAVRKSFSLDISISASIGIVLFPQGGRDFDELYKKADAALYSVKSTGKDAYAFYSEEKVQLKPIMGNPTRIS